MNKNTVLDIFREQQQDNLSAQFERKNLKRSLDFKIQTRKLKMHYNRLRFFQGLNILKGRLYLEAQLKRISISKQLFILELEQGTEVFIPPDLCINRYPQSFRFYDHILNFIKENLSTERKDFYCAK